VYGVTKEATISIYIVKKSIIMEVYNGFKMALIFVLLRVCKDFNKYWLIDRVEQLLVGRINVTGMTISMLNMRIR